MAAQQSLDFGTSAPNDGESLNAAFTKLDANDTALYASDGTITHVITDVASAATCDIGAAATDRVRITGTVTITSLGTVASRLRFVHFSGALTLTHNATSLICIGGASILTVAGDVCIMSSDASGNWRMLSFNRGASLATGDFSGPASATDNAIVRFDATTGKIGQNSIVSIDDSGNIAPVTTDTGALGTTALAWADAFFASGGTLHFADTDWVATHTTGILTVGTGDLRVTTAGTNTASVVTVGGTQTLTAKTLTSPTIGTSPTAAGATWTDLGTVTTADINGGTIDGTIIGGASAAAGTFTTIGGAAITGTGLLTVSLAGNAARLVNTTDGASVQVARFEGDRATMAASDEGYLSLMLSDSGGTQTEFGRLSWVGTTVTDLSEAGRLDFAVATAGTLADEMQLDGTALSPSVNDGLALGTTLLGWADYHAATGHVWNVANGDAVITHSTGVFTVSTGDLRVTTAGTNTASAVTVGGTQTLTGKSVSLTTNTLTGTIAEFNTALGSADFGTFAAAQTDNAAVRADGTAGLLQTSALIISDTGDLTAYDATNDGNPVFAFGASATERLTVTPTYDALAQTLNYVLFQTDVASVTADKGLFRFSPDGTAVLDIDDGGINFAASKGISIAGTDILIDAAGTATLSNIDALDATTEATIEAAIDTLANLTSIQGQTVTLAGAFITSGANSLTLTTTGATNVTLPMAGTLATLAGSETLTGKSIDLTSNTLVGSVTEFNTALEAADFATFAAVQVDNAAVRADGTAGLLQTSALIIGDTADLTAYDATNDGNPVFAFGASATERLTITPTYDSLAQTINYVLFQTDVASVTADKGLFRFSPDGVAVLDIDDGGINFAASKGISIAGTDILTDAAGTATLSNIDALDATTEATIEAAIDTLANLTSIQGVTVTLADAGTIDVLFGWDDSGSAYKNFVLADILTEGAPAAGDFVVIYGAEGDLRKVNWSSLPGAGAGISNVVEDTTPELGGNLESNNNDIKMEQFSLDAVAADIYFQKSRNAVIGSHTIVAADDDLGKIIFQGSNGTSFDSAAQIRGEVDGTPGAATDMPGRLVFSTTADGSATLTDRLILDSAGILKPSTNDGVALGTTALGFADLHLATGGVINWANGEVTLTETDANTLTVAGATAVSLGTSAAFTAGTIELGAASDTTISRSAAGVIAVEGVPLYSNIPQNSQSAAYTTVLADAQKHILHPTADNVARTFTIDANATVAYPIGTAITFVNQINTVTIAITTDTLILAGFGTTGSRTLAANGIATALKITSTSWLISGSGLT